ncbi:MAG: type I methionyl aminopeptidase [Chthonomonas sp.]|nr:type I methionyl aminopeptidase [Chthonomonas sp.]
MIILKTQAEIALMRESGRILAKARRLASEQLRPGITTGELDDIIHSALLAEGATPSFLNYQGSGPSPFPKSSCLSVNEEVVHGIPGNRKLKEGDIIGIDIGVYKDGFHTDSAWTFPIGEVSDEVKLLLRVARESLEKGIERARAGARIGDVSAAIQKHIDAYKFGIVRELVGHGIGRSLHEEPSVPNFGRAGTGPKLKEGMTFCIEPMVNLGTWKVKTKSDGWTMVSADGRPSAHFEHTVAITKSGAEILTVE